MCDESEATAEQRERAQSPHPDVLIVDKRCDWKVLFPRRADCDCRLPWTSDDAVSEEWDRCLLQDEVGEWETQADAFVLTSALAAGEELELDLPALLGRIRATSILVTDMKSLLKVWERLLRPKQALTRLLIA